MINGGDGVSETAADEGSNQRFERDGGSKTEVTGETLAYTAAASLQLGVSFIKRNNN